MDQLEKDVQELLDKGQYDPHHIFNIIYHKYPVHYSKVREAIHAVKQR